MKFPIAIHKDEGSVYGVTVPDIPGCYSWGNNMEEAVANTGRAIELHLNALGEQGLKQSFMASSVDVLREQAAFVDAVWAFVDVDLSRWTTPA